jgi:hypothetical protein
MKTAIFKNSVIALAIVVMMVSCGGRSSNAQQQSGGSGEAVKTETKSTAQVAGSMEPFAASDRDYVSDEWIKELAVRAGIKNLGKPQGSSVRDANWGDMGFFQIEFTCDKPASVYTSYAKAMWDLSKSVAENGELYGDKAKSKSVKSLDDAKSIYNEAYQWYYSFGGNVWEVYVSGSAEKFVSMTIEKK